MSDTKAYGVSNATRLSEPQYLFIDGKAVPSSEGTTFPVSNPMTGKDIYECSSASVDDYKNAIVVANKAFQTWSRTPPSARRGILLKAAEILESYAADSADAADILSAEVSATKSWVQLNLKGSASLLRDVAGLVSHIKGEIIQADRPGTTIMVLREAVGVVFAISPWNAPVNLTARAIAAPLICGNTVVLKPSEFSPKSQYIMIRALTQAGLPPGCLNFLPTRPSDAALVTEMAVKHHMVRRVNFTGSDRVGTIIAGWAASVLKQCVLELGGKAPVLVLEDANIKDAVEAVVFGALSNNGQICMSTERVIVHNKLSDEFKKALLSKTKTIKCGNHHDHPDVALSGLYTPSSATRILGLVKGAISDGAELLTGDLDTQGPNRTILSPHILDKVTMNMDISSEETFGPIICLYEVSSDEEAIEVANASEFSLCASIFSQDVMRAMDVAKRVRAGSVHINGPTVYIEPPLPNGGTGGRSGYGRFGGMAGVEEFTERKILTLAQSGMTYPI